MWKSTFSLLHWLSLTLFRAGHRPFFSSLTTEQSTKHYEENTSNLWTIGVWEIILSSFIFPSKPTDPWKNKLDIFNSCFDVSILIPVLTTASQLLLWLHQCLQGYFKSKRSPWNIISRKVNIVLKIYKTQIKSHIEYWTQAWGSVLRHGNWFCWVL